MTPNDLLQAFDGDSDVFTLSSDYYDLDNLKNMRIERDVNGTNLTVMHLNIQGLNSKLDRLQNFLNECDERGISIHVVMLCETFLNDANAVHCQIPGYNFVYRNRVGAARGGVAMYISNILSYSLLNGLLCVDSEFETIGIEASYKNEKYYFVEVYRVPNTNESISIDRYNECFNYLVNKRNVFVSTDQNFDLLNCNTHNNTLVLLNNITSLGFIPAATKPTRITHKTATLIDNIYIKTKHTKQHKSGIVTTDLSDHLPVIYTIDICLRKHYKIKYKRRPQLSHEHLNQISQEWDSIDWRFLTSIPLQEAFSIFHTRLLSTLDSHAPVTERTNGKHNYQPWLSKGIIKSIHKKERLYKQSLNQPKDHPHYRKYHEYKTCLKKIIRTAKNTYFRTKLRENYNNARNTWKIMNTALNKTNNKHEIQQIINDNTLYTDNDDIAKQFNEYFNTVGINQARKVTQNPSHHIVPQSTPNEDSIFLIPTDENEIQQIITKLKNKSSSGHDHITTLHLKQLAPLIIHPLSVLFNRCLSEGEFPTEMKTAKIIPIYKKNDKTKLDNYRPIALLPSLSKILERIIANRLMKFFSQTNAIDPHQYGFRPQHSTSDAITQLIGHIIQGKELKHCTLATFLDFSKAFDTINHETLLSKLLTLGIRGIAYKLLQNYLSNRKQYCEINNTNSEIIASHSYGVPQGSILGPILFVAYINDLHKSLTHTKHLLYADDTTLYITGSDIDALYNKMNHDLHSLHLWCQQNSLLLNTQKSCSILFPSQNSPSIAVSCNTNINNSIINRLDKTNFLGITIADNLSWKEHTQKISNKIAHGLYALNKIKYVLPEHHRHLIYNSLIESHLTYGIHLWGYTQKQHLHALTIQQKKAVRHITNSSYNAHTDPLFKHCNIMKLPDLTKLHSLKLMHRVINAVAPPEIQKLFPQTPQITPMHTRQIAINIPLFRSPSCQNTILYHGPKLIHTLTPTLKTQLHTSLKCFSKHYKQNAISIYN